MRSMADVIYGSISFPQNVFDIVDTSQFQRLRDLKQLGSAHFVFNSAHHSRFEHCLGVAHLAKTMGSLLKANQEEIFLLTAAGLLHDIGHGPFSHTFEKWIHLHDPEWHHEQMSVKMIEHLVNDNALDWDRDTLRTVQELIVGVNRKNDFSKKGWMFDIVSNSRHGVDVDKFDYLVRDPFYLGVPSTFDARIIMESAQIVDDEVCYHENTRFLVYQMFQSRYVLHKNIYTHQTNVGVDLMTMDILESSNFVYRWDEMAQNPIDFCRLDDTIVKEMERSNNPDLEETKQLIKRLRNRDLYVEVGTVLLTTAEWDYQKSLCCNIESLTRLMSGTSMDKAVFSAMYLNFGRGNANPMNRVSFYNVNHFNFQQVPEKRNFDAKDISLLSPVVFEEIQIRLFVKTSDLLITRRAIQCFEKWASRAHF